jgi:hypothetical protein
LIGGDQGEAVDEIRIVLQPLSEAMRGVQPHVLVVQYQATLAFQREVGHGPLAALFFPAADPAGVVRDVVGHREVEDHDVRPVPASLVLELQELLGRAVSLDAQVDDVVVAVEEGGERIAVTGPGPEGDRVPEHDDPGPARRHGPGAPVATMPVRVHRHPHVVELAFESRPQVPAVELRVDHAAPDAAEIMRVEETAGHLGGDEEPGHSRRDARRQQPFCRQHAAWHV